MMKRIALIPLLAVLAALAAAVPAEARFFGVVCKANQNLQVDPIVSPGVSPSAHLHTFFGATHVTQYSTTQSLEQGGTSCTAGNFAPDSGGQVPFTAAELAAATSGMWIPTMYVNGVARNPAKLTEYWSNTSIGGRAFVDTPEGAQMIAADAHASGPPPEYELFWNCGSDFTKTWPSSTKPPACPSNHTLQAHLEFPVCWDGAGTTPDHFLDPGAPVPFTEFPHYYPCPSGYQQLAHTQEIIHTGLSGAAIGQMTFASGPYYTLHGDYWQTWKDQSVIHNLEQFLRTNKVP